MNEIVAFACSHVLANAEPILLVAREDGDWMFLCGGDHQDSADNFGAVGINHLLARDGTLKRLLELPDNTEAERASVGDDWTIRPIPN
jgi:hypothetical protein